MSGLPKRFPRASLLQHAAFLESRINALLDETWSVMASTDPEADAVRYAKLDQRYKILDQARAGASSVRMTLWDLP